MLKKGFLTALVALAFLALQPLAAYADMVPVTGSDLVGSRSSPGGLTPDGLVVADGWTEADGGFKISWTIVAPQDSASGYWEYSYTISDANGDIPLDKGLSHLTLEVSTIITSDNVDSYIFHTNQPFEGPDTWSPGNGNTQDQPADLYGIKVPPSGTDTPIPDADYTFSFWSTQNPVWGDFFAADGSQRQPDGSHIFATAWNANFGTDPTSSTTDFLGWIPVPDTESTSRIPEPSALLLLVLGASGVLGSRLRRRK
jgi:hypothetical protein